MLHETYKLIHSLSPTECEWVKKYSLLYASGKGTGYLSLMEEMQSLSDWNEQALRANIAHKSYYKSLAQTSNYLHDQILKCLRHIAPQNKHANSYRYRMQQLAQARILMHRGLIKEAGSILYALERQLLLLQKYTELCTVLRFSIDVEEKTGACLHGTEPAKVRLHSYLSKVRNEQNLLRISTMCMAINNRKSWHERTNAEKQELKSLQQLEDVTNPQRALTTSARYLQLSIQALNAQHIGNKEWVQFAEAKLALLNSDPDYASVQVNRMHNTLDELLIIYQQEPFLHLFENTFFRYCAVKGSTQLMETKFSHFRVIHAVTYYSRIGDYLNLGKWLQTGYNLLSDHKQELSSVSRQVLYTAMAAACLQAGRCSECLDIVALALGDNLKEERPDYNKHLRHIQYLAHYWMGNASILDSLLRSLNHYTATHSTKTNADEIIVNILRGMPKLLNQKDVVAKSRRHLAEVNKLHAKGEWGELAIYLFWRDLLNAMCERKSLSAYLPNHYQQFLHKQQKT